MNKAEQTLSKNHKYKIGKRVLEHTNFFQKLAEHKCSHNKCALILKEANFDQLLAIVEACLKILKRKLPITYAQKRQLQKRAFDVRKISRLRSETGARRILGTGAVIQKGEGGPIAAAAIVASVLLPFLSELASKHIFSE